jgi:putative membrane protein
MRITCALALLGCAISACSSSGSEAAERRSDTAAGQRDSVAAVAASSMNESNVLALLELTHAADSALGALGAATGTATDVKEFGRMILREHHALRKDAADIAARLGLTPVPPRVPPDDAPADMRDNLAATQPGAGWDRAYMDYAIAVHEASMENTARALAATQRPEVKQFVDKSVPILQKHIDKARSLRKSLPKPPDATPPGKK